MNNNNTIELANSELVSINGGGPLEMFCLVGGAVLLAYELGNAAGKTIYYVTH